MIDDDDTVLLTSSTDSAGMNSTVIAEQEIYRNPSRYYEFVPDLYDACIKNISRYETWGDDVTLQPASNHYGLEIRVYTSYDENWIKEVKSTDSNIHRTIQLSFYAELHYNSVLPDANSIADNSSVTLAKEVQETHIATNKKDLIDVGIKKNDSVSKEKNAPKRSLFRLLRS